MLHASPLGGRHLAAAARESGRTPLVESAQRPGAATGHRVPLEIEYLPYRSPEGVEVCELVASFGPIEPEYAAVRRGAALVDAAQRGTLLITGRDRRDFLQRMVTQDLRPLVTGRATASFWLNRKGRIEADLLLSEPSGEGSDRMVVVVDASVARQSVETLSSFVFSEETVIADAGEAWHWLELHGPAAGRALALAGASTIPGRGEAAMTTVAGVATLLVRQDLLGERGWLLGVARDEAPALWDGLVALEDPAVANRPAVRPIGWLAYNIARVEAGSPFFQIDFGTSNLPHETGILDERVSFTKGCYLGQEVVARMQSLGKPKQMLVGLRPERDLLPIAGAQVFEVAEGGAMGSPIGTVTSSTLAPMLSSAPIAFAMVKSAFAAIGTRVVVTAEGEQCEATVGPLQAWTSDRAGEARA